mgnify:CR=1 FL=1
MAIKLVVKVNYIKDIKNGEYKEWYENENLKFIFNFIDDKTDGECKEFYEDGDTIAADIKEDLTTQVSNEILPVKLKAESLLTSMDSILTTIKLIFNENTQDDIQKSVASIKNTLTNLDRSTGTIDTILKNNSSRFLNLLYVS